MFRPILIPTDGSELAGRAVHYALELAMEQGAEVTAVTVSHPFHVVTLEPEMLTDSPDVYARHVAARMKKNLDVVSVAAKAAGVKCNVVSVEHEHPYQGVIDTAQTRGCVRRNGGSSGMVERRAYYTRLFFLDRLQNTPG